VDYPNNALVSELYRCKKVKIKRANICYSTSYRSALQSRKWQLIGMN